jgi:chemotaxis protein methyltransferase CheR
MFRVSAEETQGRSLRELGSGQWDVPQLHELLTNVVPRHMALEAFEVEHDFPVVGRRVMLLNAREICHPDSNSAEILLVIEDVTERRNTEREKDELLRQREILMKEMQHRVNNTLQIIASILMLKANSVRSEETRRQLKDAHERVLSVAAVQKCLQASDVTGESIKVGTYLSKLCDSLRSSMISEARPFALEVQADAGWMTSAQAISIGLITTELVINALKHAFPDRSTGRVIVGYRVGPEGWHLSVSDDGIGKPAQPLDQEAMGGLGTSLIEALARQLNRRVKVITGPGGTTVSVLPALPRTLSPEVNPRNVALSAADTVTTAPIDAHPIPAGGDDQMQLNSTAPTRR